MSSGGQAREKFVIFKLAIFLSDAIWDPNVMVYKLEEIDHL